MLIFSKERKKEMICMTLYRGGDNNQVMRLIICKMFYYNHPLYGTVPLSGCLLDTKHDM